MGFLNVMDGRIQILASIVLTSATCLAPQVRAQEPDWSKSLEKVEQFFNQGRGLDANALLPQLKTELGTAPPRTQLAVASRVIDLCSVAYLSDCKLAWFNATLDYFKAAQAATPPQSKEMDAVWTSHQELWLRFAATVWRDRQYVEKLLKPVQDAATVAANHPDFLRANLTIARAHLLLGDKRLAWFYLQRAWYFFLCSHNMTRETFSQRLPEFVELFDEVGQHTRARIVMWIADELLGQFAIERAYMTERLFFQRVEHAVQQSEFKRALALIEVGRPVLAAFQYEPYVLALGDLQLSTKHAVLCALAGEPCDEKLVQDLLASVAKQTANGRSSPLRGVQLEAAVAYAINRSILRHPIEPRIRNAIAAGVHKDEDSSRAKELQSYVLAARAFIAAADGSADHLRLGIDAARHEAERLSEFLALNPFDTAPYRAYSSAILQLGATLISQQPQPTREDAALLLTISELLSQSQRSVESRFQYLASQFSDESGRSAFQSAHRIEQRLWHLEREALRALVNLPGTTQAAESLQFDVQRWLEFSELDQAARTSSGQRERAAKILAAPFDRLDALQSLLGDDEVFVSVMPAAGSSARICVGRDRVFVGRTLAKDDDVVSFKTVVAALSGPAITEAADATFPLESLLRVSDVVLGYDERCVGRAESLIVAVPAYFLPIPLATLVAPGRDRPKAGTTLASVPWLGASHRLSTVIDAAHFIASRRLAVGRTHTKAFLGIGDPRLQGVLPGGGARVTAVLRGAKRGGAELSSLDELPDTRQELLAAAKAFNVSKSTLLLGDDATELALRSLPLDGYRIVSFATHGLVREELPGVTEAALVLTPADAGAQADDGLLTATEISQLRLPADLVILSACNSASFDVTLFGPEAASLSSAFLLAGARTTLASLWSVDSEATARWMGILVRQLGNESGTPSAAVRDAIRGLLASSDGRLHHPRYWSSFALFGDGHSALSPLKSELPDVRVVTSTVVKSYRPSEFNSVLDLDHRTALAVGDADIGNKRVAGVLSLFRDTKLTWEVIDPEFSLMIPSPSPPRSARLPLVIAWRRFDGQLQVELRAYNLEGQLESRVQLAELVGQFMSDAVSLPSGNVVIATHTNVSQGRSAIWLQEYGNNGKRIRMTSLASQPGMATTMTRLFPSSSGTWVAIEGRVKRRQEKGVSSAIGAVVPCETERRTDLLNVDGELRLTADWRPLWNIAVADIQPGRDGVDVVALTTHDDCAPIRASFAVLGLLYKHDGQQRASTLHAAPLEGFATEARTARQLEDGSYLLISAFRRTMDADIYGRDRSSFDFLTQYPARNMRPGHFRGVQLNRFSSQGARESATAINTGGDLFVTGAAEIGRDLLLVGTSNWHRFAAVVSGFGRE